MRSEVSKILWMGILKKTRIMTHDHIDDFAHNMDLENVPFLAMVPHGKSKVGFRIVCKCKETKDFKGQEELLEHINEYFDEWRQEQ
jgi:hypothetical protein